MTDTPSARTEPRVEIGDISGRIIEAGRGGSINSVTVDCGHGHCITLSGMSDTVTKQFAANLYKYVLIEFGVQHDG